MPATAPARLTQPLASHQLERSPDSFAPGLDLSNALYPPYSSPHDPISLSRPPDSLGPNSGTFPSLDCPVGCGHKYTPLLDDFGSGGLLDGGTTLNSTYGQSSFSQVDIHS